MEREQPQHHQSDEMNRSVLNLRDRMQNMNSQMQRMGQQMQRSSLMDRMFLPMGRNQGMAMNLPVSAGLNSLELMDLIGSRSNSMSLSQSGVNSQQEV